MTDSNNSLNEVPALLDERRQYEGWLAALDARRESTPRHVFDRVQADYKTRLQRVAERLASHRSAIESERASVQTRLSLLAAEEQLRRDERAELELRTHVGELAGEEADRAFGRVDEVISRLVVEKNGLTGRLTELQILLAEDASRAAPAPVPDPVPVAPLDVAVSAPVIAPVRAAPEPAPRPHLVEPPAAVRVAQSVIAEAPKPAVAEAPKVEAAKDERAEPARPRESFDELAFLSSIVGKGGGGQAAPMVPDGPLVERRNSEPLLTAPVGLAQEERPGDSLLAGLEHAKPMAGERPLAANVSANMPIVLRTAAVTEQVKTLKCNECGAMNYPTEWYCERCGAELAAL